MRHIRKTRAVPFLLWAIGSLAIAPAYATASQEDYVRTSWQVSHPVVTGVLSAFTFGHWPAEYGADMERRPATRAMNHGLGEQAMGYVRGHNEAVFRNARSVTGWLVMLLVLAGCWVMVERRRRGKGQGVRCERD